MPYLLLLIGVLFAAILFFRSKGAALPLTQDPASRMQLWKAVFLLAYLIMFAVVTGFGIYGLWAAEPAGAEPVKTQLTGCETTSAAETPNAEAGSVPKVIAVEPATVFVGQGRAELILLGCNFASTDQVLFNGTEHIARFVNAQQIFIPLTASDFSAPDRIFVAVRRGTAVSESVMLWIRSAFEQIGKWDFFGRSIPVNQELRLLALVLFTGCFGASVFGLKSLADYIGTRNLTESWFTFYLVKPFVGAGIGLLFYLVLRGGFLAGTNADIRAVNPFGISAIAALVGAYADQAFQKLYEVFQTLFQTKPQSKAPDPRPDNIGSALTIKAAQPDKLVPGTQWSLKLEADGGTPPLKWKVEALPSWLTLDESTGALTGIPPADVTATRLAVQVTDGSSRSSTAELNLAV